MAAVLYIKNLMPNSLMLKLGERYININPGEAIPYQSVLVADPADPNYNQDKLDALVTNRVLALVSINQ